MNDNYASDLSDYRLNKARELPGEAKPQLEGCMKFILEVEDKQALFLRGEIRLPNLDEIT